MTRRANWQLFIWLARIGLAAVSLFSFAGLMAQAHATPRILIAWGFGDGIRLGTRLSQLSEPLPSQEFAEAPLLGRLLLFAASPGTMTDNSFTHLNWTGSEIFVAGACGVCGEPFARPGSFVIASLPTGIGWANHASDGHQHLSELHLISPATLIAIGLTSMVLLLADAGRFWRRPRRVAMPAIQEMKTVGLH